MNKKKKKNKDSEIKIRINTEEKKELIIKSSSIGMNLSSYLLKAVNNYYDILPVIPDMVKVSQAFNEIVYAVKQENNEQLLNTVHSIIRDCVGKDVVVNEVDQ